jgi:hypothetical protein
MWERHDGKGTPLSAKVEQMLIEARVIIPGAQALLGFQLTVTLTRAFEQLPYESKLAHAAALCCIALSVILLMADPMPKILLEFVVLNIVCFCVAFFGTLAIWKRRLR